MRQFLCSRLIGRTEEMDLLRTSLDSACAGGGRTIVISGEAGVGKSRLVREMETVAREAGLQVLRGRSVEGSAEAYRPIAEALLGTMRGRERVALPSELAPFQPVLGRLIPEWRQQGMELGDNSVVL